LKEGIQSVKRALYILERLSNIKEGIGASELAREMGVNRSTVFRLMETLMDEGFVRQDEKTKRYHLTMKVFSLGNELLEHMNIVTQSRDILERLQQITGHTIHLAIRDMNEVVYIDKIISNSPIQMYSKIGRRAPLYCTGLGKAILPCMSDKEIEEYLKSVKLIKHTPNTIADAENLKKELEKIRTKGYSLDLEEHESGIRCVGAPIFDYSNQVIGSISVATIVITLNDKDVEDFAPLVVDAANEISKRLGARRNLNVPHH